MRRNSRLAVRFFRTAADREPVREWLNGLDRDANRTIGEDIKTVQYGWPIGMPVVRKLDRDLWEVRSALHNATARVLFTVGESTIILLHGFIKKSQKTPKKDLAVALNRLHTLQDGT